ncbi:MAG: B12-binding domain-containing radical SAM protein [Nanoarchaeota archaeon]|nr:B12-binding domain-containing radical SAM protein [Nanoarchaeota archaeon]MBU1621991.1 B12-binding domain-containing radical SAM protein [Nanoarchaeota archaeon]
MADVVLVNPMGWKMINDQFPPFALMYTAILAEKEFSIKIIDQRVDKNWKQDFLRELKKDPLCVGVTCITGKQIINALEISKLAKENSNALVVWGGIHATQMTQQTLQNEYIDAVIQREGEVTFYEFMKALAKNKSFEGIKGLWYKENGRIKNNPPREFVDLNELPEFPYHLIDIRKYISKVSINKERRRSLNIITSRGCPHQCTFCHNSNEFNRCHWRSYNSENVLKHIDNVVQKYGIQDLMIIDDNYFVNPKRSAEIAKGLIDRNYDLSWNTIGASVQMLRLMDLEYLKTLKQSGLKRVLVGAESGSPRILNEVIKKGATVEQLLEVNKKLHQANIAVTYSFVSGFPTETKQDLKMTVNLLFKLKKDNPLTQYGVVKPLIVYPGTELFRLAVENGFQVPKTLSEWSKISWDDGANVILPWLTQKRRKMLNDLYYSSLLMNPNYIYINSKLFTAFSTIVLPLMKYRTKHLNYDFPVFIRSLHRFQQMFL